MISSIIREESKDLVTDVGAFRVTRRTNTLTGEVSYAAFEPLTSLSRHNNFKQEAGELWGNVAERLLTPDLDKRYEGRPERRAVVEAYYKANRDLARSLIVKAYPEAARGLPIMGAVVLPLRELPDSVRTQMTARL